MEDLAELIEGYITSGIAVFPLHGIRDGKCTCGRDCASPGKHPLLGLAHGKNDPQRLTCKGECGRPGHGLHDATTDPGQVSEWLGEYGAWCNWGGRPPVGAIVLDVDPRNDGHVELRKLEQQNGPLTSTLTAQTGSGGLHHWFRYNGPTRGKLCPGVDVKTNAGYVVLPPSRHASGGVYFWLDYSPAADAPDWVKARMNPPIRRRSPIRAQAGNGDALVRFVASRTYGEINDALYWAACRADENGLLDDDMEERLVAAARQAAGTRATPEGEKQSRRTINSARNRPPDRSPGRRSPHAGGLLNAGRTAR